jgi:hypothetical protein
MDRLGGRTIAERVRSAAGDAGILPGDPLGPVVEALADIPAEIDLKLKTLVEAQKVPLTGQQIDDIGRHLLGGCQAWSRAFVRTSFWSSQVILALVILGAVVVGFGAGWRAHSPPSELACGDEPDGSRICWMYTRLPTAAPKR